MIFGMMPLSLALAIGKLITSTLLPLFVVSVFYTVLDDLALKVMGKKQVKAAEPTHAYGD